MKAEECKYIQLWLRLKCSLDCCLQESRKVTKIRVVLPYGSATVGCSFYTSACLRHQIREGEVFYVKKTHRIKFNYPSFVYLGTKKGELSLVKMM